MRYPGGKGGAGVFQTIINQFPPHRVYVEAFAGGANVFQRKAPASSSVLVEVDREQAERLRASTIGRPGVEVLHASAFDVLSSYPWVGDELVYLDPPYLHATRKDLSLYRHELSDAQHLALLDLAASIPAMVAISGYRHAMYDEWAAMNGWRSIDFQAMTRRGVATETLWMNYAPPARLADYAYAGQDFRERERIKRKAARFVAKWDKLPALERHAIVSAMGDRWGAAAPVEFGEVTRSPASSAAVAVRAGAVGIGDEISRPATMETAMRTGSPVMSMEYRQ